MKDINRVILAGRLTRDAEVRYTAGGTATCGFSIAVNRRKKSGEQWIDEASFFDCQILGRLVESIGKYMIKGKQVFVDGNLVQQRWQSKDGDNKSRVVIQVDEIQLVNDGKKDPSKQETGQETGQHESSQQCDEFPEDIPF
ncbi:MAG: single-stranded DNA-binding protein [Treponemataceae bacterium]